MIRIAKNVPSISVKAGKASDFEKFEDVKWT